MEGTDEMFYARFVNYSHTLMLVSPITFIVLVYALYKRRSLTVPPGPIPFPLLGNIPQLIGRDIKTVLKTYREKYGPVFTIHIFHKPIIICADYEIMTKMLVENSCIFSKRPLMEIPSNILPGKGIATASGKIWEKNRTILIRAVQQFGIGETSRQTVVHKETEYLVEETERHNGEPFDIALLLKKAVINITFSVLFGRRYNYNDKELNNFLKDIEFIEAMKGSLKPFSLRFIPGDPFKIRAIVSAYERVCRFYKAQIDEHLQNVSGQQPSDMIDEYIRNTMDETQDASTRYDLVRTIYDAVGAAKATLSPPLLWGIVHLIRNPDVQEKIHTQIVETVGEDELPDDKDITNMPHLRAAVLETLRVGDSVPFTFPYMTNGDGRCLGYRFPQHAVIFPCLRSVLRDDRIWGDADIFRPSRFLKEDSSELVTAKEWIPFSIGTRRCPGEKLAMSALHLFISGLLQKYKLLPEENKKMPSLDIKMNLFIEPKPFLTRAVKCERISTTSE